MFETAVKLTIDISPSWILNAHWLLYSMSVGHYMLLEYYVCWILCLLDVVFLLNTIMSVGYYVSIEYHDCWKLYILLDTIWSVGYCMVCWILYGILYTIWYITDIYWFVLIDLAIVSKDLFNNVFLLHFPWQRIFVLVIPVKTEPHVSCWWKKMRKATSATVLMDFLVLSVK